MLNWLRKWLLAQAERDAAVAQAARLEQQLESSELRLFTEINSNRQRESELVNALLAAQSINRTAGPHARLGDLPETPQVEAKTTLEPKIAESEVEFLANQFIEAARQTGRAYTKDAEEVLRELIRRNPDEYTS